MSSRRVGGARRLAGRTIKKTDTENKDSETTEEKLQCLKDHFLWLLSNDFYKDECSAEQVSSMESYLPADYADAYEDLPE